MAKKQKSPEMQEICFQDALIPETEQPYKVPANWVWTRLGKINHYQGKSIDPSISPDDIFELYSVPSCGTGYPEIITGSEIGSTKQIVTNDDVLICKINPRINRVWIVSKHTDNLLIASSEWIIVRNSRIYARYLMWCFQSYYFREYMLSNVSGVGGSLMRSQPKYVSSYPVPLPPLPEQQRIVERIENLFEKLERAKELAKIALDSLETRKAAILQKAFKGELTAKWREENGMSLEGWEDTKIGNVFEVFSGKGFKEKEYARQGVKLLRITNVTYEQLIWNDVKFLPEEYLDEESDLVLKPNDIVMALNRPITNGKVKVSIVDQQGPYILYQRVGCLRAKNEDIVIFYLYYMQSRFFKHQLEANLQGSDQPYLNLPPLKAITCPRPSVPEQQEIVRILDSLFEKEQRAKEFADVIGKIDLMKKTILARAFRGELGTNDPREESSERLLEKIQHERII